MVTPEENLVGLGYDPGLCRKSAINGFSLRDKGFGLRKTMIGYKSAVSDAVKHFHRSVDSIKR